MRISLRLKIALGMLLVPTLVAIMLFMLISAAFQDVSARTRDQHEAAKAQLLRYSEAAKEVEALRESIPGIADTITRSTMDGLAYWLENKLVSRQFNGKPFEKLTPKEQRYFLSELARDELQLRKQQSFLPFEGWLIGEAQYIAQSWEQSRKGDPQPIVMLSHDGQFANEKDPSPAKQPGYYKEAMFSHDSTEVELAARAYESGHAEFAGDVICLPWPTIWRSEQEGENPDSPREDASGETPKPLWVFIFKLRSPLPPEESSFTPIADPSLGVGADRIVEPAPVDAYVNAIAGVIALGALLFVGVIMLTVQRVVMRPIESLVNGSQRIASGDYSLILPETGGEDEVSRLIRAFNRMQAEIRKYQRGMQKRIEVSMDRIREQERSLVVAQRLAATGTLAAGLAHEINNPLGSMLNAVRRIQKTAVDERTIQYCDIIREGAERIQTLMGSILDFSRRRDTKPQFFDLRSVLQRSAEYVRYRFHGGRELEVDLPLGLPEAWGDENGIGQVIVNLLLNAHDALDEEGGKVTLRARSMDERSIEFMVSDNGAGMDAETQRRVFDPFFTTKEVGKGTGLGLSIVHTIVANHKGVISVESELGKGTTFTVALPIVSRADVEHGIAPTLAPILPGAPSDLSPGQPG